MIETMVEINRVYRHYKGNYYHILARGVHTEDNVPLIAYRKLEYTGEEDFWAHTGETWMRPEDMFEEEVEVDGKKVPRFEKVGKLEIPEQ